MSTPQTYSNDDNRFDVLLKNKHNIVYILEHLNTNPTTPVDVEHIKPKLYSTENELLTNGEVGELGRIVKDNGQELLLLKGTNGVIAKFENLVEVEKLIEKVRSVLQTEITDNQNQILGLVETLFSHKYLDTTYANAQHGIISNDGKVLSYTRDFTTIPKDGDIGELHFENADGTVSFNLPFKMNGTISTTFFKTDTVKDTLTVLTNGLNIVITATKNGFFTEDTFHLTKAFGNSNSVDTSVFLTTTKANTLYAPKIFDYSSSNQGLTFQESNGKRYQYIAKPADENAPVGTEIELTPTITATDANELPQDSDQILYGNGDLIWIKKADTNIMSWDEIKDNVNAGKTMVLIRLADEEVGGQPSKHYELVRWESKPKQSIVDLTTIGKANALYNALTPLEEGTLIKIKRTRGNHIYFATVSKKGNGKMEDTDASTVDYIGVNIINGVDQIFIGSVKIPNRDEDWDTHFTFGDAYLFQNTSGNINLGFKNGGWIKIGESATGIIDIGSTLWVDGDNKGQLIHGAKKISFEKIIEIASKTATPITLTADDGTVVNGTLLV